MITQNRGGAALGGELGAKPGAEHWAGVLMALNERTTDLVKYLHDGAASVHSISGRFPRPLWAQVTTMGGLCQVGRLTRVWVAPLNPPTSDKLALYGEGTAIGAAAAALRRHPLEVRTDVSGAVTMARSAIDGRTEILVTDWRVCAVEIRELEPDPMRPIMMTRIWRIDPARTLTDGDQTDTAAAAAS
jgi:hypothetical protein